ncbi:uncharacterized protein A1O9_04163, partial [Exophiala aquamarina CBS 119918]
MPILITYATSRGSTREVAERIASRLHDAGFGVDCRPVDRVYSVDSYSAVILGSAVHSHRWLLDALKFLDIEAMGLQKRPVWTFSVSMAPVRSPSWMRRRLVDKEAKSIEATIIHKVPKVRDHRLFAGKHELSSTPLPMRLLYSCIGGRLGDHRNWNEIDAWSNAIAKQLAS